jgi:hypothetical protein
MSRKREIIAVRAALVRDEASGAVVPASVRVAVSCGFLDGVALESATL